MRVYILNFYPNLSIVCSFTPELKYKYDLADEVSNGDIRFHVVSTSCDQRTSQHRQNLPSSILHLELKATRWVCV